MDEFSASCEPRRFQFLRLISERRARHDAASQIGSPFAPLFNAGANEPDVVREMNARVHSNDGEGEELEFFFFHHESSARSSSRIAQSREKGIEMRRGFLLSKHRVIFGNNSWTIRGESIRVSGSLFIVPCIGNIIRIRARMDGIDYCDDTGMM